MKRLQDMRTKLNGNFFVKVFAGMVASALLFSAGLYTGFHFTKKYIVENYYILDPADWYCYAAYIPDDVTQPKICVNFKVKGLSFEPSVPGHRKHDTKQGTPVYSE